MRSRPDPTHRLAKPGEHRLTRAAARFSRSSRADAVHLGALLAVVMLTIAAPRSPADVFHLTTGGRVEGDLVEQADNAYHVETLVGIVVLPADSVARIETAPSPFEPYRLRRAAAADTPADQYALAVWCGENGFGRLRRTHLQRAIELDSNYEPARSALGHVQVDGVWVNERAAAARRERDDSRPAPPDSQPAGEPAQSLAAVQAYWFRYISVTRSSFLESIFPEQVQQGHARIRGIQDAQAVPAALRVLSDGDIVCRQLLIELLDGFATDAALAGLADLAVCDPDRDIRRSALTALSKRDDPRLVWYLRQVLAEGDDLLVKHAAEALGLLNAREAVPDLIAALTAQRVKTVPLPMGRWFNTLSLSWGSRLYVGHQVMPLARYGLLWPVPRLRKTTEVREVTVYRTEVLEALRQITGTDFGFDAEAWTRWYEEHPQ